MLAAVKPSNQKADLYETIQIPVRKEFLSLTGNYESAVFLNQIIFSNKEELTLNDIRRLSLSDRTKQTLRKKLDELVSLGLVTKRQHGQMYNRYLYKAANDLYPNDNAILALIEGLDLRSHPCYLTASILNKFRQFALSNTEELHISSNQLRLMLGTEKSVSLVRLILKRLVAQNYLSERLIGGVYNYRINTQKLTNIFNPEETERQTEDILSSFLAYIRSSGHEYTKQQKSSWRLSFKRMLSGGYNHATIKHIIAFLGLNLNSYGHILTPVRLKKQYDELYRESYEKLSKRKGMRFIYKLLNGLISERKPVTETKNVTSKNATKDYENWQKAKELVDKEIRKIKNWYNKQTAGVTDIDLDDYINQAILFAYERFSKGKNDGYDVPAVKYRLDDYMYNKRNNDKSIKRGDANGADKGINNIVQYFDGDISEIIDRIQVEAPEEYCDNSDLAPVCEKLLSSLDPRTAGIISDYHGLGGRTYTFKEIASKYGLSSDGYANRLYHKGLEKLRSQPPPGLSNLFKNM